MDEPHKHGGDEINVERARNIIRILYEGNPQKKAILQKLPDLSLEELKKLLEIINEIQRGDE